MQIPTYAKLLNELESDMEKGLIKPDEKIYIVRMKKSIYEGILPIIDFFYEPVSGRTCEEYLASAVQRELRDGM
jgi:hypothetical protein